MAKHNEIGALGEKIAANFLRNKGLKIVQMNYWKPYGEIDIVACETSGLVRFVEVKTVSYETGGVGDPTKTSSVSGETYRPEENVHPQKMRRLRRVVEAYVISHETEEWEFDVVAVYIDKRAHNTKVKWLKDIVLG